MGASVMGKPPSWTMLGPSTALLIVFSVAAISSAHPIRQASYNMPGQSGSYYWHPCLSLPVLIGQQAKAQHAPSFLNPPPIWNRIYHYCGQRQHHQGGRVSLKPPDTPGYTTTFGRRRPLSKRMMAQIVA